MAYKTHVGSLDAYEKGVIELSDDLRKYAFSNVYEVAGKAAPFERFLAHAENRLQGKGASLGGEEECCAMSSSSVLTHSV